VDKVKEFLTGNSLTNYVLDEVVNQKSEFKTQTGVPHFKFSVDGGVEFELPGAQDEDYFVRLLDRIVDMELERRAEAKL